MSERSSHAESTGVINGESGRACHQCKAEAGVGRRKRLNARGKRAARNAIDAEIQGQLERMHELIAHGHKKVRGNLVFDFEVGLLGIGIRKLARSVAQRKLEHSIRAWIGTTVGEFRKCLTR